MFLTSHVLRVIIVDEVLRDRQILWSASARVEGVLGDGDINGSRVVLVGSGIVDEECDDEATGYDDKEA